MRPASCCRSRSKQRGLKFLIGAQTQALIGDKDWPRDGGAVQGRQRDPRRPRRDGRRHPPEHRARREDRPALQPRHRRQRHDADHRPTRASTRWANAPRTAASPTAWWRRCSSRARCARRTWRSSASAATPAARPATKLKVTGIDLFSAGDFMGGADCEEIVMSDPVRRRLQEARDQGRQAGRRLPVRRHGRRLAGTSSCCAKAARSATSATS